MILKCKAFPRAALVGNPSDGYFGKTIAFVFHNYSAEAELYESPELDLLPSLRVNQKFSHHFTSNIPLPGSNARVPGSYMASAEVEPMANFPRETARA